MPLYDLACANCGKQETFARMNDASRENNLLPCPVCDRPRPKLISMPQFQEDRTRFFRGALGNGYSHALGQQMPDSRSERDRVAKQKGVEFIGLSEHLAENKEAAEAVAYRKHVDAGGERVEQPAPGVAPNFVAKPAWAKGLIG